MGVVKNIYHQYLLYYYTKDYKHRRYTYIAATDINDAWNRAKELYGEDYLEIISGD